MSKAPSAIAAAAAPPCRLCGAELRHSFIDLGMSPLCESVLKRSELGMSGAKFIVPIPEVTIIDPGDLQS